LVEQSWRQDCAARFSGLSAYLIGLRCPLEVLEEREKERRDRTLGQARLQYTLIHEPGIYDLEVDTSRFSVQESAAMIIERVQTGQPPAAFKRLDQFYKQANRV
ncbi:MAG: hypothetical protein AAGU05_13840, partial [Anaerolineaceae bacterium]